MAILYSILDFKTEAGSKPVLPMRAVRQMRLSHKTRPLQIAKYQHAGILRANKPHPSAACQLERAVAHLVPKQAKFENSTSMNATQIPQRSPPIKYYSEMAPICLGFVHKINLLF